MAVIVALPGECNPTNCGQNIYARFSLVRLGVVHLVGTDLILGRHKKPNKKSEYAISRAKVTTVVLFRSNNQGGSCDNITSGRIFTCKTLYSGFLFPCLWKSNKHEEISVMPAI